MNGYNIVDISNNVYDVNGIKLQNGKTSVFYKKKGTTIQRIIVIRGASIAVREGDVVLSLNNDLSSNDIINVVNAFFTELFKVGINVKQKEVRILVNNTLEEEQMKQIFNRYGISFVIENTKNNMEELSKDAMASGNTERITKEENGKLKQYSVSNGKVYEDNGNLSLAEQKRALLENWMQDEFMNRRIAQLSKEELDNLLMQHVTFGKKEYYMEHADNNTMSQDKKEALANSVAYSKDGKYNAELGIMEEDISSRNKFAVVEENNNKYNVVNPEVSSAVISTNSSGSTDTSSSVSSDSMNIDNFVNLSNNEEQMRDISDVYYIDNEDFKIYDSLGNEIGMLGKNGYSIDSANNVLTMDGKSLGYVDDFKNMYNSISNEMDKSKVKTRVLEKKNKTFIPLNDYDISDDRTAFVSFPVILLVMSVLFFVGSIILYFMT